MLWCLPGFFGLPRDWDFLGDHFSRATVPLLWQKKWTSLSLGDWGAQFAAEVKRVDREPVLLGYSLGGRLAAHALLAAPELFRAAIFVSTHFGLGDENQKKERQKNDELWSEALLKDPWESIQKRWNEQAVFAGQHGGLIRREKDYDRARLSEAMRNWSLGAQDLLLPRFGSLKMPSLFMAGSSDSRFCGEAEKAAFQCPHSTLQILSGLGHRLPWENPDLFEATLSAFAKKLVPLSKTL